MEIDRFGGFGHGVDHVAGAGAFAVLFPVGGKDFKRNAIPAVHPRAEKRTWARA